MLTNYRSFGFLANGLALMLGMTLADVVFTSGPLFAAEPATIRLWEGDAPGALGQRDEDRPTLIAYSVGSVETPVPAVLVCPGGGYGGLAMGHEGDEIARWWNEQGVSAFILDYRHRGKGYGHPAPLTDAQRGLRMIRAHAAGWHVDPHRVGVMGFSAGGHLASTLGTHFDAGNADAADPVERESCRPDFMILCYPVIAFGEHFTHRGSQRNLLGDDPSPELLEQFSNHKQVTADCPPTFLFHTHADQGVSAENSVVFYQALLKSGVPAELHVYQRGPHGVGLARDLPGTSTWPGRCLDWLRQIGVTSGDQRQTGTVEENSFK